MTSRKKENAMGKKKPTKKVNPLPSIQVVTKKAYRVGGDEYSEYDSLANALKAIDESGIYDLIRPLIVTRGLEMDDSDSFSGEDIVEMILEIRIDLETHWERIRDLADSIVDEG